MSYRFEEEKLFKDDSRKLWQAELKKAQNSSPPDQKAISNYQYLLNTYNDSYFKHLDEFFDVLPRDGDIVLLILKGHLLVEKQVRRFVHNHFPNQQALKGERWEASTMIAMGKAHCEGGSEETMQLWDAVKKLNNVRNYLAHRLDLSGLDHKLEDFLKCADRFVVIRPVGPEGNDPVFQRLSDAINALHQKVLYLATNAEKRMQQYETARSGMKNAK